MATFDQVLRSVYKGHEDKLPQALLCLDPGETTGWAVFERGELTKLGQAPTVSIKTVGNSKKGSKSVDWPVVNDLFIMTTPTHVVCEDYRIYAHKLERHTFSSVETLRLIGGIDMICHVGFSWVEKAGLAGGQGVSIPKSDLKLMEFYEPIPISYQMAVQAKGFVTDEKLKQWGFWKDGMRHSRDAIRHGIYYLLVTNRPKV